MFGKYEGNDVAPSVDMVKKLAETLDTTVGYVVGETKQFNFLKNTAMVRGSMILSPSLKKISITPLDALIKNVEFKPM